MEHFMPFHKCVYWTWDATKTGWMANCPNLIAFNYGNFLPTCCIYTRFRIRQITKVVFSKLIFTVPFNAIVFFRLILNLFETDWLRILPHLIYYVLFSSHKLCQRWQESFLEVHIGALFCNCYQELMHRQHRPPHWGFSASNIFRSVGWKVVHKVREAL